MSFLVQVNLTSFLDWVRYYYFDQQTANEHYLLNYYLTSLLNMLNSIMVIVNADLGVHLQPLHALQAGALALSWVE